MGNRIVHFEIPVVDTEKMSKFYGELFGWKLEKQPMAGMDYWLIETTGKGPTDLGGGMYAKQGETERLRFYVNVENIEDHTNRFKQAGGTVVVEKQEIPGVGYSVLGTDPEGNTVGLFQPITQPSRAVRTSSAKKKSVSRTKKSSKSVRKKRK